MVDFLRALSIVLLLGMFYLAFKNKKFKRFLLIESVLIIVFIIGRQMYTSNLNTMDTVMWSLASDVTNKMITQSDKILKIICMMYYLLFMMVMVLILNKI